MNILKVTFKQNNYRRNFDSEIDNLLRQKWGFVDFGSNARNDYRSHNEESITRYYTQPLKESDTVVDTSMRHMTKAIDDIELCWKSMMWKKHNNIVSGDMFEPWASWDGSEVEDDKRELSEYVSFEVVQVTHRFVM